MPEVVNLEVKMMRALSAGTTGVALGELVGVTVGVSSTGRVGVAELVAVFAAVGEGE